MTIEQLIQLFGTHDDEFLKFNRVTGNLTKRPDLHAFNLIDRLVPGNTDIVSSAEHDTIWLDVTLEQLAAVITEQQVLELIRCGVHYDNDIGCLSLYVC